jgi:hypothetical protein
VGEEPLPVRQVERPSRQALQQGFFQTKHAEGKKCFNQCCGLGMFIPDSNFLHPGSEFFPSRIRIKEFKYFKPKKWFLSSRKYDPGSSSWTRILTFLSIPDPASRGQKGTGSQIRIRDPGFNFPTEE